jgi:hypothetical protein
MTEKNEYVSGVSDESFSQLSVKQLFLTILFFGALSIIMGVIFGSPLVLSVLIPLVLVGLYAFATSRARNTDLSKAKIGDSCYFLGFSFTLISLSVALINLGQQQGNEVNIGAIVGSFGAALATTLAGLLCRLWFTTLASSFQSSKDKLEEEIEAAMKSFSLQLQNLVDEVNMSITAIGATIGDTNLELNKSYKGQMQDNIKTISSSVTSFSKRLDEVEISKDMVVAPVRLAMSSMIDALNEQSSSMLAAQSLMTEGTNALSTQINDSNQLINAYLEKFNAEFKRISDSQISVFEGATVGMTESLSNSLSEIGEIKSGITQEIFDELDSLKDQLISLRKVTETNNTAIEKTNAVNGNATKMLISASETLPKVISNLEKVSLPISESSKELDGLVESLSTFQSNLTASKSSLDAFTEVTENLNEKMRTTATSVDSASIQLSSDIEKIYTGLAKQLESLRRSSD